LKRSVFIEQEEENADFHNILVNVNRAKDNALIPNKLPLNFDTTPVSEPKSFPQWFPSYAKFLLQNRTIGLPKLHALISVRE
jgi:hypothetical protein